MNKNTYSYHPWKYDWQCWLQSSIYNGAKYTNHKIRPFSYIQLQNPPKGNGRYTFILENTKYYNKLVRKITDLNGLNWHIVLLYAQVFKQIYLIPTSLSIDGYGTFLKECWQILLHYRQSMSDAGYSMLGAGAWGWPTEMLWGGRWEGGSCLGTHVRIKDFKIKKIKN